ncbi:L-threonine ammonia-lyase isoform X1 [Pocillopora verrucosa]|uniref:L-threonine ammonia-lyase isoform X1 n=1 Tax=Pocillopora verrucosa TaxID=203993 RepID=UPI003341F447
MLVSWRDIERARDTIKGCGVVVRTPLLRNVEQRFGFDDQFKLHLKMENMQNTGSFKIRGVVNQFANIPSVITENKKSLVSMSAGNYGKAFALATKEQNLPAILCMPETAPINRAKLIESFGVKVERIPTSEIQDAVDLHVAEDGMHFLHPFDDLHLISGFASVALEILEDIPEPDVVVVCCGGGGLLSGVAAGIKLKGKKKTRIFGVEPEGAPTMYLSKQQGHAVSVKSVNTIAAGLAPPYAGKKTFQHVKEYVEDIVLVTDEEIKRAVKTFYQAGLVVEPSGAAAFAALQANKIPDLSEGSNVVAIVTGGNVTPEELCDLMNCNY